MMLCEKIKLIRELAKLSQREFAQEIGCAQSLISAYERGLKKPSYDLLVILDGLAKKYKTRIKLL